MNNFKETVHLNPVARNRSGIALVTLLTSQPLERLDFVATEDPMDCRKRRRDLMKPPQLILDPADPKPTLSPKLKEQLPIARITTHIPDKGQVMIRYYGLYSDAHRGMMRKRGQATSVLPILSPPPPRRAAPGWRDLIRKVYEVDPQTIYGLMGEIWRLTKVLQRPDGWCTMSGELNK